MCAHICETCKPKLGKKAPKDTANNELEQIRQAHSKLADDVTRLKKDKTRLPQDVATKDATIADLSRANFVLKAVNEAPISAVVPPLMNQPSKRSRTEDDAFPSMADFAEYIDKLTEKHTATLAKAFEDALSREAERFNAFERKIDGKYIEVVNAINEMKKSIVDTPVVSVKKKTETPTYSAAVKAAAIQKPMTKSKLTYAEALAKSITPAQAIKNNDIVGTPEECEKIYDSLR